MIGFRQSVSGPQRLVRYGCRRAAWFQPPDPLQRPSANHHSLVDPLDTRPTPPRNAIVVLRQPPSPEYDMISAACIRAATSRYESLKTACRPEAALRCERQPCPESTAFEYCGL